MRAHREHTKTTHTKAKQAVAAAVALVTLILGAGTAHAARRGTGTATPVSVYDRFAFEFEVVIDAGPDAVSVASTGTYVEPGAQDCEATVSFGPRIELTRRAVVIEKSTWVDEGRGLKKAPRRDFDWETECPSSAGFWQNLPFDFPTFLPGTTEQRDGIAVEHVDLADEIGSFTGESANIQAERASIWRSKKHDVVVGLDFLMHGSSEDACRRLLEMSPDQPSTPTCTIAIRLDVSQINDHDIVIRPGRGSKPVTRA